MLSIYDLCSSTLTQFTVNRGFCRWYQAGRRARPAFCQPSDAIKFTCIVRLSDTMSRTLKKVSHSFSES